MSDWAPPESDFKAASWSPPESDFNNEISDPEGESARALSEGTRGIGSTILNAGRGAAGAIVGGYAGINEVGKSLLKTGHIDTDKASNAVKDVGEKTVTALGGNKEPESEFESDMGATMRDPMNPINWPAKVGAELGDVEGQMGGGPGLQTLTDIGGQLLTPAVAGKAASTIIDRPVKATKTGASPQDVINQSSAQQSMGAAGASRDISNLSNPLKQKIASTDPTSLNHEALDRHAKADQFGIQLSKGEATQDPTQWTREFNSKANGPEQANHVNGNNQKLIDALDSIRRDASPSSVSNDPTVNGQQLIDKYKQYDAPKQAEINNAYKQLIEANGGKFPVDGQLLANNVRNALDEGLKTGYAPQLEAQVAKFLDGKRQMTGQDFESMRTDAAAIARGNDPLAKQAAAIIRQQLESLPISPKFNNKTLQMEGDWSTIKPLADKARSLSKARFEEIEADPAYEAAVNDYKGNTFIPAGKKSSLADDFVQKHVVNGSKADLEIMQQKFAGDDDAKGVISAAPLNFLKKKAGIDPYESEGDFRQSSFNSALNELRPNMEYLLDPETAQKVQDLGQVARWVKRGPSGESANRSGTAIEMMRQGAQDIGKRTLSGAVSAKTMGLVDLDKLFKARLHKKFVEDAYTPGAGIDWKPAQALDRPIRASGGKVDHEVLVNRLINKWKEAKKATDKSTEPLLNVPDATIMKALDIAGQHV